MQKNNVDHTPEAIAERLLPEGLSHLLTDRPLLWREDPDEYDALLGEIFAELDPKGTLETILVKDLVDYIWEVRRMRALKVAALQVEMPRAISDLVRPQMGEASQKDIAIRYQPVVFAALAGKSVQAGLLKKEMEEANVTPEMAQYAAFKNASGVINALEATISRLERRRDQLLKQIEGRRQAFKAMARGLIAREEAEDLDPQAVN
jgi:hypothetical protein